LYLFIYLFIFILQELLRQREVITNIEQKTDEINTTLTTSQRHLNNIKSVFGGIKNWWGNKKDTPAPPPEQKRGSSLDNIVRRSTETSEGASGRSWGDGEVGVGLSDRDLDSRFLSHAPQRNPGGGGGGGYGAAHSQQYIQPITGSAREEELNRNLGNRFFFIGFCHQFIWPPGNNTAVCHSVTLLSCGCIILGWRFNYSSQIAVSQQVPLFRSLSSQGFLYLWFLYLGLVCVCVLWTCGSSLCVILLNYFVCMPNISGKKNQQTNNKKIKQRKQLSMQS
jgi:hypothetical protein